MKTGSNVHSEEPIVRPVEDWTILSAQDILDAMNRGLAEIESTKPHAQPDEDWSESG